MAGRIQLGVLRSLAQPIALRVYRAGPVRRFVATPLGADLFEAAYFKYKELIEVPGTDALRAYLAPGAWAVDIGANVGFFTEKFARWVNGGKVLAVEPEVGNFNRLSKRLARQGLSSVVVAMNGAAAPQCGTVFLTVKPEHPGDHTLSGETGPAPGTVPVPAWRLDDLLAEQGSTRVGLIKIDVQGAEMRVLAGAESCINRDRPAIFIEIDDHALRQLGTSAQAVLSWLAAKGYTFAFLSRSGPQAVTRERILSLVEGQPPAYCDVLAVASRC
jgi:FkbM family methyltransferase